jgi:hypothetical protein
MLVSVSNPASAQASLRTELRDERFLVEIRMPLAARG